MYYKKIAGLFLLVSFQSHCMLMVNQQPKKKARYAAQGKGLMRKAASIENYLYNSPFFKNKMIPDMQPVVISNLDHRSNIQLIATSKHLYNRYVQQTENGGIYHPCLFTKHPFQFSSAVDFNIYFRVYTRALFRYAPQHEAQSKILLSLEDESIQASSAAMLEKFIGKPSDENVVINFYRQKFTYKQYNLLVKYSVFFKSILKRNFYQNSPIEGEHFVQTGSAIDEEELLKMFLADPFIDPNIQDERGDTILHDFALCSSKIKLLKILFADDRIDLNIQDEDGCTAFHNAIVACNSEVISVLLADPRVDINTKNKYGNTAFHEAASSSESEVMMLLFADPRCDINAQNKKGWTVLHKTVRWGDAEQLKILVADPRINLNIQDQKGCTVIHKAVLDSNIEALEILLANPGVDLSIKNNEGMTAHMIAASRNNVEMCTMLTEASLVHDKSSLT